MINKLKKKLGQGMVEFALIFCIVAIASGAIASTEGSFRKLMNDLGQNIADQSVWSKADDGSLQLEMTVPQISTLEEAWGIKTAPTETGKLGTIQYEPSDLIILPEEDDTGKGGFFSPIAQFQVAAGSAYDEVLYYDTSYDPDGGEAGWLMRYWLLKRLTEYDTPIECQDNSMCAGKETYERFETGNTSIETSSIHTQQFSFHNAERKGGEIIKEDDVAYKHYCLGTAQECLPKYYANGKYSISLLVKDRDGQFSSEKTVTFEVKTKADYYSYVDEVVSMSTKFQSQEDNTDEYVSLVDHEFGLITDLYGVEHVVIQNNMLRTSVSSTWTVVTTAEVCKFKTLHSGKTGEMIWKDENPIECWTKTSEREDAEGMDAAGFSPGEGNMWTQEKMEANDWKFYVYDKRSLYYKGLFSGFNSETVKSPELNYANLKTDSKYNSLVTLNGADGVWKVSSYTANFKSMPQNSNSRKDEDETYTYSGIRNLCTASEVASEAIGGYDSRKSSCAEGKTYMFNYLTDHPQDHLPDTPYPRVGKDVSILGWNNDGAKTSNPDTGSDAAKTGNDMEKHTVSTHGASSYAKATCVGTSCMTKWDYGNGALEDNSLVLQAVSNYDFFYIKDTPDKINGKYRIGDNEDKSTEEAYRDSKPDFNDGSLMYQLRQNAKGTNKRKNQAVEDDRGNNFENDYKPEFVSVRLSLADNSPNSYNPGYNAYSNKPFTGDGQGCSECTEPNYNEDVQIQWTEVRSFKIPGNTGSTSGSCNGNDISYNHKFSTHTSLKRNARTRQMNIVEHFAFDWVYEYSGSGRNQSPSNTYKIKRAHWHTMGRTEDTILSGKKEDPYTKMEFDGNTENNRYLSSMNPKRVFTETNGSNLPANGNKDMISDPEYWKILTGKISITLDSDEAMGTIQHTHTTSCTIRASGCKCGSNSCTGSKSRQHYYYGKVDIKIDWVGMSEIVLDGPYDATKGQSRYTEKYWMDSHYGSYTSCSGCSASCKSCPEKKKS